MTDTLQSGGDPLIFQHFVWFLGHPGVWLTLISLLLCGLGAIKLGRAIRRKFKGVWFVLYLTCVFGLIALYFYLVWQWYKALVEGAQDLYFYHWLGWFDFGFAALAIVSLIWIVSDALRKKSLRKKEI